MEVSAAHTEKGHGAPVNRLKANIWSTDVLPQQQHSSSQLVEERCEFSGTSENAETQPALCWTGNSADRTDCNLSFDIRN